MAVIIDEYLDDIFTPQGDVVLADRDELDNAYSLGELTIFNGKIRISL